MHDPMTVAFDISIPFTGKRNSKGGWDRYPTTFITIWHVDPETDGTDDSCGWFMRARHGKKDVLDEIKREFSFAYNELFDENGDPRYSSVAVTLQLFRRAAYEHFNDWRKVERYMQFHLAELIWFAENPVDSLYSAIMQKYGKEKREYRIEQFASVVYSYILRDLRPWYRHPRWHIHHWEIQIHPIQNFKRWAFSRCAGCGGRFSWGYSVTTTQWESDGPQWFRSEQNVYHSHCIPAPNRVSSVTVETDSE
jgi:hypothetical protein